MGIERKEQSVGYLKSLEEPENIVEKMGTANSGNHGHAGRPGKVGGSSSSGSGRSGNYTGARAGHPVNKAFKSDIAAMSKQAATHGLSIKVSENPDSSIGIYAGRADVRSGKKTIAVVYASYKKDGALKLFSTYVQGKSRAHDKLFAKAYSISEQGSVIARVAFKNAITDRAK